MNFSKTLVFVLLLLSVISLINCKRKKKSGQKQFRYKNGQKCRSGKKGKCKSKNRTRVNSLTTTEAAMTDTTMFFDTTTTVVTSSNAKPTTSTNPATTNPTTYSSPENTFCQQMLESHNSYRAKHGNTDPLEIDPALVSSAQIYADKLADDYTLNDSLVHSDTKNGENLYRYALSPVNHSYDTVTGAIATKSWYDEHENYDYEKGNSTNGGVIGHFTQVIWNTTSYIGCGIAIRDEMYKDRMWSKFLVVAQYYPPGNYQVENLHRVNKPI